MGDLKHVLWLDESWALLSGWFGLVWVFQLGQVNGVAQGVGRPEPEVGFFCYLGGDLGKAAPNPGS